ncbi:unnamed protein product [Blepharisma stoltei]|uniref:Response regulator n=1 Tax=Blepharisma stoltei TaxID=1481888 RepID=A0AAU9JUD8_9CILI|nr:unnamed protein product [Blepharisma stoltei]
MDKLRDLWWKEEIEISYKSLIINSIVGIFPTALRVIKEIFVPANFHWTDFLPFALSNVFVWILTILASKLNSSMKLCILLLMAEFYSISMSLYSRNYIYYPFFEMLSFFLRVQFTFSVITTKIGFCCSILTHMIVWHYWLYADFKKFVYHTIIFIFSCGVYWVHTSKVSFEHFSYRNQLESTTNRLNTITQSLFDGIIIISVSGEIDFFNEKSLQLLNTNEENLKKIICKTQYTINKKISDFNTSNSLWDDISYLLANSNNQEYTLGITTSGCDSLEWKARNITWEDHSALFVSIRNANHIIMLEEDIAKENVKNLILRSASHELKTPLNSIIHFTNELLENFHFNDENIKKILTIISVSSKLMLSLINDLLDYSKILAGELKISKTYCDIRSIVANVCNLIHLQAERKGISVVSRIDPSLPAEIFTDQMRLSQVLLNLLTNAVRHTLKGKIEISLVMTHKNHLKIYVEDSGIGMEKPALENLLASLNSIAIQWVNLQGNGFGLYISNLLIKLLGGKGVQAKSVIGKCSIFYFQINLNENDSKNCIEFKMNHKEFNEDVVPEMSLSMKSFKEKRRRAVLIVDDTEFNLEILESILKKYQISYAEARNGQIAVNKVVEQDSLDMGFKVIIMDCSMPVMNGWEASRLINHYFKENKIKNLPNIIGYSAYNSDEDRKLCYESGMVEFLHKPCSSEELIKTVIKYL